MSLTVIVPNYNHAKYLPECLEAILSQSFSPLEIIVIDDKSTDDSLQVIKAFQNRSSKIRLIENERNLGVIQTANNGISFAKGEFLAFCAADDMVLPGFFERTMKVLKEDSRLGLCCADPCEFVDQKPYRFKRVFLEKTLKTWSIEPHDLIKKLRASSFWIASHSTIYRRSCVVECGMLNSDLKYLCDWYLNYQIAARYPIAYLPFGLGAVRIVPTSYARTLRDDPLERRKVFDRLIEKIHSEKLHRFFCHSGLFGQIGIQMILYLLRKPRYWLYLPRAFVVKAIHFFARYFQVRRESVVEHASN